MSNRFEDFSPKYLRDLYRIKSKTLDEDLVKDIKIRMIDAALAGYTFLQVSIKAKQNWEMFIKHFEDLGFFVSNIGNDHSKDYDSDGDEIYIYRISWYESTY